MTLSDIFGAADAKSQARLLGVSPRAIKRWRAEGLPRSPGIRARLLGAVGAIIRRLEGIERRLTAEIEDAQAAAARAVATDGAADAGGAAPAAGPDRPARRVRAGKR